MTAATSPAIISIFCVDGNREISDAIRSKLALEGGFRWLGQLPSADRLAGEVERLKPDIVLLDIDMPGRSPFAAMEEAARASPQTRFIMLSGHVRRELIDQSFAAGAWGYVSKNESTAFIINSLRRVHAGEVVMSSEVDATLGL
jgi:DNA-binding NarL/FixJ family response regulator